MDMSGPLSRPRMMHGMVLRRPGPPAAAAPRHTATLSPMDTDRHTARARPLRFGRLLRGGGLAASAPSAAGGLYNGVPLAAFIVVCRWRQPESAPRRAAPASLTPRRALPASPLPRRYPPSADSSLPSLLHLSKPQSCTPPHPVPLFALLLTCSSGSSPMLAAAAAAAAAAAGRPGNVDGGEARRAHRAGSDSPGARRQKARVLSSRVHCGPAPSATHCCGVNRNESDHSKLRRILPIAATGRCRHLGDRNASAGHESSVEDGNCEFCSTSQRPTLFRTDCEDSVPRPSMPAAKRLEFDGAYPECQSQETLTQAGNVVIS